ncbi:MAG TPA: amino acid permease [Candidatus Norongarragalinales archaeon]|jgi:APA family basic amino acid/polyamine antiporter|nr:amino acid permease [Candidatus Norongarragalinales archaeon]
MAKLKRVVGLVDAIGMGLGAMVGGGIYVLSGIGAGLAGPAVILSFLIAGVFALFTALSVTQLARAIPLSGASYEYAHERVGPLAGFLTGIVFTSSKALEAATVALALGAYLAILVPSIPAVATALLVVGIFTFLNYRGIKTSVAATNSMVLVKMGALLLLVLFGLSALKTGNFSPFAPGGFGGIMQAAALVFFAFTGFARVATLGEEIEKPRENIPKASFVSLAIATLTYLVVSAVAIGIVGAFALSQSSAPLAFAASMLNVPGLAVALVVGGVVATASVCLGDLLAVSRVLFAMGRNKDLPQKLGEVHRGYGSPHVAVIIAGVVAGALVLTQSLAGLALFTSLTILLYYAFTNYLAAAKLKKGERQFSPMFSIAGAAGCLLLSVFIPLQFWLYTIVIAAAGLAYYFFAVRKK